ncbi:MAG: peptide/nickel transport system ATP-binding protein [Thermotogaceae bacterium]|jgi:oligopeptide/dipeptide ABC transporter ATP-binding protein|nr:peptide/nickel transport system ATP-binding protein [Thermotogaceae bacterium]MDN5337144.1 peptide/nickel transport system ATP-binding protein [Thermotogaceae bacterium]
MNKELIKVEMLRKYYHSSKGLLKAVDSVSFKIYRGETFGLVGESGCGKSTLIRTVLRLLKPSDGKIVFDGIDITHLHEKELKSFRKRMGIVFQDPHSSLNPRMTVFDILSRPLKIHKLAKKHDELMLKIVEILKLMGLQAEHMIRFPHELSGGQKQRVAIARALMVEPEILFLDEPTSALDVSVQAKILKLLDSVKKQKNLTYFYISHDINLIRVVSDRIAVMYLGKIVEIGDKETIFHKPLHPYTNGLFKSVPVPDPDVKIDKVPLEGEVPSPVNPPEGCRFHPRCEFAKDICIKEEPVLKEMEDGRMVACHLYQ